MNNKKIEETLNYLSESPLFYLFCSSKELFHSNFLYWMSTLNKNAFYKLFCNLKESDQVVTTKREAKVKTSKSSATLDILSITKNGDRLIIENKVKDIAKDNQLVRILNATKNITNNKVYILLTLFKRAESLPNEWKQMTYKDLSSNINSIDFTTDTFNKLLIDKYKDFINTLFELGCLLNPVQSEYNFAKSFQTNLFKILNDHKLFESYQKISAEKLINSYNKEFSPNYKVCSRYSIHHQKATLDFCIKLKNGVELGIQVEDDHYRKFISSKNAENDIIKLLKNDIFFDNKYKSPMKKKKYLNFDTTYRYQYGKLSGSTSYEELFERINNDLEYVHLHEESINQILLNKSLK